MKLFVKMQESSGAKEAKFEHCSYIVCGGCVGVLGRVKLFERL